MSVIRVGRTCKATIRINDYTYNCDYEAPHPGIAHHNETANAVWCSDGEARKHQTKKPEHKAATPNADMQRQLQHRQLMRALDMPEESFEDAIPDNIPYGEHVKQILRALYEK